MTVRHYGFSGTQAGCTPKQLDALTRVFWELLDEGITWQHNGDCIGADEQAGKLWLQMGGAIHLHPPGINSKRAFLQDIDEGSHPKPYRERNQDIVNASERLVATPGGMEEELRSGTWMTIRMARRKGIPRIIVWPDGTVTHEG